MGAILKNKTFLLIFSVVVAIIGWFVVVTIVSDEGTLTLEGVPVNINVQSSVLGKMGLNPIEGGETTVEAVIYGKRSVIGGVSVEDITVTASLAGVSGAGTYELELMPQNTSGKDFEVLSISPSIMRVKFDRLVDKTIKVEYDLTGDYTIPEGYLREDIVLEPAEITVTGPENDIAAISKIVATAPFSGTIDKTTTVDAAITVEDKNGATVDYNTDQVTLSADSVQVTMPLLKSKELPVRFEYLNVPTGFPIEDLKYKLSAASITVAGPTDTVDNYSDILIGYIDVRDITLENTGFAFTVKLPDGFINTDNIDTVRVDFDLTDYVEKEFYVSNFVLMNVPVLYNVEVAAQQITVKMIGPADVINSMTAKDIVAEVDVSDREVEKGQYMTPLTVYAPNGSLAWSEGGYEAAVNVRER